ncbi:hypothetical protein IPV09_07415 [Tessaracoccus sp. SD287]|uniref:sigma factor-like helix-turn-helix DNA-binding protein n=1 Tax=Tessaracoccus sp. SD287 TaxID=2782008 RepID=UPI001A95BBC1|nr:sigma factor-like helix-turn-helix DNA-binding protein [Tessaracoccus sp. SD287]MBO1031163.1 hypothetical protein [Tessaracoccus sp. SD287]
MEKGEEGLVDRLVGEFEDDLIDHLVFGAADLSRAYQMARRYALGETLQEIGDDYGVTRERIRQIINTETPWSTTSIGAARRRTLAVQAEAERRAVLEWSEANVGAPIEQAVAQLKLNEEVVRKYLGRHRIRHELVEKKAPEGRSLDALLADLRRFYAETGGTSAAAYGRWAKNAGVPGQQTIAIRFGSWNDAAARAGIKDAPPIERERRYSDEDLWAAVLDGIRAGQFTAKEFEDWLVTVEGAPSLATIRNRLPQKWNELRDEALRILGNRSERDEVWINAVSLPRDWPSFLDAEDPIVHMRAARLALGKNITMVRYTEWAQATKRPGVMTICRRSGMRWGDLVDAVGGVTVQKQLRIPDDELLAWLRVFLELEPEGSYRMYEDWREAYGAPTAGTITLRFGGWDKARAAAHASG